jgi:2-oxoisovalerate dehydrogenase E2 component (dihydrolipoyl transacylase)
MFIVSNIGSTGGDAVAPIILAPMVEIVGLGRIREVPVFLKDEDGGEDIVKQKQMTLSWIADHRIIDGATVAKAAKVVEGLMQNIELMSREME